MHRRVWLAVGTAAVLAVAAVCFVPRVAGASAGNVVEDNFVRADSAPGAGWGSTTNGRGLTNRTYGIYNAAATGYHIQSHAGQLDGGYGRQADAYISGLSQSGGDALLQFRFASTGSARALLAFNATVDDANHFQLLARSATNTLEINTRVGGGISSTCGTPYPNVFVAGTVYWLRFDVSGGRLSGRVWRSSDPEPQTWQTSCNDGRLGSGAIGTGLYWENPAPAATAAVYCYAVAAAGSVAQPCVTTKPEVTGYVPVAGDPGYQVTISGRALTRTTSVLFNGVPAQFTVRSDTALSATVPGSATTGPLAVATADGASTSVGAFTVYPRPAVAGVDTSRDVHLFMPFTTNVQDANTLVDNDPPVDLVWGYNHGPVAAVAQVPKLYYAPFDREQSTRWFPQAHDLAWFRSNHPDWIEYRCDRTSVAYEFDATTNVPLNRDDPAVREYLASQYFVPALTAGSGYSGIAFDNLQFNNGGTWSGQRCGHYDASGGWVAQYNGTADDPAYRASVVAWAAAMRQWMRASFPGQTFGANMSPDPSYPEQTTAVYAALDLIFDEQGFTNGNAASPGPYTDGSWLAVTTALAAAARQGHGLAVINQQPVSFAQVTKAQVQWALANYLLVKNAASGVWISGQQEYGTLLNRPEYAAATVGAPTGDLFADQGVYRRDFTTGLALVNPSSAGSRTVQLPANHAWRDLYGGTVAGTVTLPAAAGLVLVAA
ncbi:IPT/TIG domain-containing protein [Dactylosporangium sp. CA-092794]|uniref:IPT/TIG domain-containing protein n=1 Tax=Dactylosporangium sp. CA-092794 TaxID=3239929 RepID=UPI003D8D1C9A